MLTASKDVRQTAVGTIKDDLLVSGTRQPAFKGMSWSIIARILTTSSATLFPTESILTHQ